MYDSRKVGNTSEHYHPGITTYSKVNNDSINVLVANAIQNNGPVYKGFTDPILKQEYNKLLTELNIGDSNFTDKEIYIYQSNNHYNSLLPVKEGEEFNTSHYQKEL